MRKIHSLLILTFAAALLCGCKHKTSEPITRGVDLGWLSEMEHDSVVFRDDAGHPVDCIELMRDHGATAVRLRVWVNHKTGWCNKEDVLAMARRVHAAGLKVMIDFHYADYWADPQGQPIPEYWRDLNLNELCLAVAGHTTEILEALKAEGIEPTWVQIGNETTNGMLWPYGAIQTTETTRRGVNTHAAEPNSWANYVRLSNAGYEAAKNVFPNVICITHIDNAFLNRTEWFEQFTSAGGKWDMAGLSHYPFTQDTINPIQMNALAKQDIIHLYAKFGKPVMVTEIGTASWLPGEALEVMTDFCNRMSGVEGYAGLFYWEPECYGGWVPAEYKPLGWGAYGMGCMNEQGQMSEALKVMLGSADGSKLLTNPRRDSLLSEWDFYRGEDSVSEKVHIPHDWAISGPFDRSNDIQNVVVVANGEKKPSWKTGRSGGLPWMGKGHYHTTIPACDSLHDYTLFVEGAMSHADIFLNGEEVCYWPYGYNSFDCFVLPSMKNGRPVNVDIYLENKPQQSRWYPGAGLYRPVHLITTAPTHVATFGTCLRTPVATKDSALITLDVTLAGPTHGIEVVNDILYGDSIVAIFDSRADRKDSTLFSGLVRIAKPHLWSPETPNLYIARTRVYRGEILLDEYLTRFGIRSVVYDREKGFLLNGQVRKFKGVCLHHDLGPLGVAVHRDALIHQITMLRDMGCDAIRSSHNMPAPELVSLCDSLGMMLLVEPFDVWDWAKTENDYSKEYKDWHEWDITNMVKHFRNNASVMMWSSGNEVWNQTYKNGAEYVRHLQSIFHRLDPTRPVTCGMDQAKQIIHNGFGAAVDIPGLNYRTSRYVEAHENLPQGLILGSETASTVSSRGVYKIPVILQPDVLYPDGQCSGYDVEYCAWSGLPDQDFALQDDYTWTIGQFVWTGFDYLGEPSPYDTDAWPSHSSYFGIIDLASLPKDRYYLYRSQWNTSSPTLHLLPHWNWSKGQTVPVFCYTSYPEAELFVNGKSQGRLRHATAAEAERLLKGEKIAGVSPLPRVGQFDIPDWGAAPRPELMTRYRLMWPAVKYEPGEIKVVGYDRTGAKAGETIVRTAGEPYKLVAEWANRKENPSELCYVTVRVVDRDGNLCPAAGNLITCSSDGFIATANGDARCLDSFVEPRMHAFSGQATFILRKGTQATFSATGLKSTEIAL